MTLSRLNKQQRFRIGQELHCEGEDENGRRIFCPIIDSIVTIDTDKVQATRCRVLALSFSTGGANREHFALDFKGVIVVFEECITLSLCSIVLVAKTLFMLVRAIYMNRNTTILGRPSTFSELRNGSDSRQRLLVFLGGTSAQ
jgi:hypothetical protein